MKFDFSYSGTVEDTQEALAKQENIPGPIKRGIHTLYDQFDYLQDGTLRVEGETTDDKSKLNITITVGE